MGLKPIRQGERVGAIPRVPEKTGRTRGVQSVTQLHGLVSAFPFHLLPDALCFVGLLTLPF